MLEAQARPRAAERVGPRIPGVHATLATMAQPADLESPTADVDVRPHDADATHGPPMIAMRRLGRRFGDLWAVRDMDLDVAPGEVLGLLGPNGAGKTTTVRLLAALIAPSEGSATVDGRDVVTDAEAVRARIGILTETPGLYEKLSAIDNLDFFGRLHGLPAALRAERAGRLLRLFDLWDRRDDTAGTFSKGMKQKLAIARALLHDPAVLFLDEPTAALDPEAAWVVRDAIAALREAGRTIVLATHNLDEAERLCDRIAFVRHGILRVDTPVGLRGAVPGGTAVDIVLAGDGPEGLDALAASIATLPGVGEVRPDGAARGGGRALTVALPGGEAAIPDIVSAVVGRGGRILEVRRRSATLEDVYFEVMGVTPGSDRLERIS
jgi:ABC-2 type transport system ATP-binding protein